MVCVLKISCCSCSLLTTLFAHRSFDLLIPELWNGFKLWSSHHSCHLTQSYKTVSSEVWRRFKRAGWIARGWQRDQSAGFDEKQVRASDSLRALSRLTNRVLRSALQSFIILTGQRALTLRARHQNAQRERDALFSLHTDISFLCTKSFMFQFKYNYC